MSSMNLMFENNPLLIGDLRKLEIDSSVDLKTTSKKEEVEISQIELESSRDEVVETTEEEKDRE